MLAPLDRSPNGVGHLSEAFGRQEERQARDADAGPSGNRAPIHGFPYYRFPSSRRTVHHPLNAAGTDCPLWRLRAGRSISHSRQCRSGASALSTEVPFCTPRWPAVWAFCRRALCACRGHPRGNARAVVRYAYHLRLPVSVPRTSLGPTARPVVEAHRVDGRSVAACRSTRSWKRQTGSGWR